MAPLPLRLLSIAQSSFSFSFLHRLVLLTYVLSSQGTHHLSEHECYPPCGAPWRLRRRSFTGPCISAYATRPIKKMPHSDGDGFCLAAPLVVSWVTACRAIRVRDGRWLASAVSSALLMLGIEGRDPLVSIEQFSEKVACRTPCGVWRRRR